jgi:putative GTP pyrophosphokinase
MHDAIGVRLIVYFYSQLPLVDKELRDSPIFELSDINPPKAYFDADILARLGLSHIAQKTKESGYTSIHYIAKLKQSEVHIDQRPFFEIQVRTLAQELWCEVEHILSYKPENRAHFSAKRRFQILSREIGVLDEHFNLLYEDLIHNQEIASYSDSDILNFENMPKVLMEIGIHFALTDLNPALKILFSRDIKTIGALLRIATPRRLMTIRNTYISEIGRAPGNLELISSIAILKESESKETEIKLIKSQIDYRLTSSYRPGE